MSTNNLSSLNVGTLTVQNFTPPASCVSDASIAAGANVDATKLMARVRKSVGQKNGTANAAQRQGLGTIHGATGTLVAAYARNITAATAGSSTSVQIKVNGANVLTAALLLDSVAGTTPQSSVSFTSTALVALDAVDADITIAGAAPGQGVEVTLVFDEKPV